MPTVLVIHAHPDDETFANAGWMALLAAQGHRVVGVIATGGEAGELAHSSDLADARRRRLAKYESALAVLGAASWAWLDPEAEWVDALDGPTVATAEPPRLRRAVTRLLEEHHPGLVLTVGGDGLTGHPDHVAVGRAVREVVSDRTVPEGAWGARLRRHDVTAGERVLAKRAGGRPVGSGRVTGTDATLEPVDVTVFEDQRRRALDRYTRGLGTDTVQALADRADRIGDSLLLRSVFDTEGWRHEHYERLDVPRD